MSSLPPIAPEEEVLSTLRADGRRRWLYPRVAVGGWFHKRRLVGLSLIVLFNVLPFLRMNGAPMVFLDWMGRKFHLFGITFQTSDAFLLALLFLAWFIGIFLVTALLGRVWCGWMCPQTIYLEFVYRPLERLCFGRRGVGGKPTTVAAWRRVLLWLAYGLVSLWLAHVFLAYFVGVDSLFGLRGGTAWLLQSPLKNPGSFFLVGFLTCAMLFDFAFWREQMCTLACPYGRLQSVLLDRLSLVVAYDAARGEPRGKPVKNKKGDVMLPQLAQVAARGDCVDCGLCVAVCPTGIDIRKGLQMECLHCTQCVDACDGVMKKFGREPGLIRYATGAEMAGEKSSRLRPRVILYPLALAAVLALFAFNLSGATGVGMEVRTAPRTTYRLTPDERVENVYEVELVNRSAAAKPCTLELEGVEGLAWQLDGAPKPLILAPEAQVKCQLRIQVPRTAFHTTLPKVTVRLRDDQNQTQLKTLRLAGPFGPPSIPSTPKP